MADSVPGMAYVRDCVAAMGWHSLEPAMARSSLFGTCLLSAQMCSAPKGFIAPQELLVLPIGASVDGGMLPLRVMNSRVLLPVTLSPFWRMVMLFAGEMVAQATAAALFLLPRWRFSLPPGAGPVWCRVGLPLGREKHIAAVPAAAAHVSGTAVPVSKSDTRRPMLPRLVATGGWDVVVGCVYGREMRPRLAGVKSRVGGEIWMVMGP